MNPVMQTLRPALSVFALLTALTGVAYPLLVTGIAQVAFPQAANGSMLNVDGKAVGSALIGQSKFKSWTPMNRLQPASMLALQAARTK